MCFRRNKENFIGQVEVAEGEVYSLVSSTRIGYGVQHVRFFTSKEQSRHPPKTKCAPCI